ncbi:MAG: class I SAM-dependent methyltransferase [Bacteroidota bacterium]
MICKDHLVTEESFAIVQCDKCELLYTNPRPEETNLSKYYQSTDYISHANKGTNLINILYKMARLYTVRNKYQIISEYQPKGKVLDYGCGTGHLLNYFKNKGWQTTGVEPDDTARNIAESENQLTVYPDIQKIPKGEQYDVIMLWHVMEHIADLKKVARKLTRHLTDNGTMIIAVPNHESFDATYYKENWAGYDIPRHLYHFNQLNIKELFKKMKVNLVKTLPMKLDAYYVSLLSEKNSGNGTNFMKAFQIGYKSNKLARKNNNNYSSLIYVVNK